MTPEINLGTLNKVKLTDIKVGARARVDVGDIEELANSIRDNGLIHPIVVYSQNGNPPYQLIAGGRRINACRHLRLEEVSVRIYDTELNNKQLKAIELFENIHRKDLTIAEEVGLIKELDDHMKEVKGGKTARTPDASGHSMRDTAKMLGKSIGSVSSDIKLATIIEEHPELGLQDLPNKTAANRELLRLKGAMGNYLITKSLKVGEKDRKSEMIESYILGDFLDNSNNLLDNSFQLIEVDPPYGINVAKLKEATNEPSRMHILPYIEIPESQYVGFCLEVAEKCWHLASDNSWMIWWFACGHYDLIYKILTNVGWKGSNIPGIWKKGINPGPQAQPTFNLGNNYESFFYMRKGDATLRNRGRANVFDFDKVSPNNKIHPMERPREMIMEILRTFVWEGSRILSPFLGSGTTILAAYDLKMTCVGYDLSEEFRNSYVAKVIMEN